MSNEESDTPFEDFFLDEILSSDKLTLDVARAIIRAQQQPIDELRKTIDKLIRENDKNPTQ